jgi:multidrug efflux pump subunit AcrA (membrane-fusion protein)
MKSIIHKPKILVPTVLVIAVIIGLVSYRLIGQTPVVNVPADAGASYIATSSDGSIADDNSVDLAFPKAGRVSAVSVQTGDVVAAGQVLASLDAGDALGAVNQAKGALELAKAQYASLNVQYANAQKQQDVLVANARRTLLSGGLSATAVHAATDQSTAAVDNSQAPTITGTYTCDKEGSYEVQTYQSGAESGYSFNVTGLENGQGAVTYYTAQPLGTCGLFIQFPTNYFAQNVKWVIDIPNAKSSSYAANKNAYDLAVATRDQVLKQLEANLGQNGSSDANIAQASIDAAQGAYETALGAYQNNLIVAPMAGTVTFVDSHLKVGQSVTANKAVITVTKK